MNFSPRKPEVTNIDTPRTKKGKNTEDIKNMGLNKDIPYNTIVKFIM